MKLGLVFCLIVSVILVSTSGLALQFMTGMVIGDDPVVWSDWLDRDDPESSGDYELLSDFIKYNPGLISCTTPVAIECVAVNGSNLGVYSYPKTTKPSTAIIYGETGEVFNCESTKGGWCVASQQPDGKCDFDYMVRFACVASVTSVVNVTPPVSVANCFDSDGVNNHYVVGTAYGVSAYGVAWSKSDSCNGNVVIEYGCNGNLPSTGSSFTCPYNCSGGKCLNVTPVVNVPANPVVFVASTCVDSDGYNYYTKGSVTYTYGSRSSIPNDKVTVSDFCSGNYVNEAFCFVDSAGVAQFGWNGTVCQYGCNSTIGACLKEKITIVNVTPVVNVTPPVSVANCFDSDKLNNHYVVGTAYGVSAYGVAWTKPDSCNGNVVIEYGCNGNLPNTGNSFVCSGGCSGGKCLNVTPVVNATPSCIDAGYKCTSKIRGCGLDYKIMPYSCSDVNVICCNGVSYCGDGICDKVITYPESENENTCPQDCPKIINSTTYVPFILGFGETGPASDVVLGTGIAGELYAKNLISATGPGLAKLFDEITQYQLDNGVTLLIYNGELILVVGKNSVSYSLFASNVSSTIYSYKGLIVKKVILSYEITSSNLEDLFDDLESKCSDFDNGPNSGVVGDTTGLNANNELVSFTDYCLDSNTVIEFSCSGDNIIQTTEFCSSVETCVNEQPGAMGACVNINNPTCLEYEETLNLVEGKSEIFVAGGLEYKLEIVKGNAVQDVIVLRVTKDGNSSNLRTVQEGNYFKMSGLYMKAISISHIFSSNVYAAVLCISSNETSETTSVGGGGGSGTTDSQGNCGANQESRYVVEGDYQTLTLNGLEYYVSIVGGNNVENSVMIMVYTSEGNKSVETMSEGEFRNFFGMGLSLNMVSFDSASNQFTIGVCLSSADFETSGGSGSSGGSSEKNSTNGIGCDGCLLDDKCMSYGFRSEKGFCGISNEWELLKGSAESCMNNFECNSNLCIDDQCVEKGFLNKIVQLLRRWF